METPADRCTAQQLIRMDRQAVWHPFTQAKTSPDPIPVADAKGAYLFTHGGERIYDAISSWWVTTHGHCHSHIANAIAAQARTLDQAIFADFTHENGVLLAGRLLKLLGLGEGKVFYTDNGSTAVEAALKMSIQYWHNLSRRDSRNGARNKIACFEHAYHGDTFGAMAASGKTPFNRPFWPYLFEVRSIPPPTEGREEDSIEQLEALLQRGDIAAFIFEPVVQGASGMRIHSADALEQMIACCHHYGTITIADEVMTGFGRTGPLFACDRFMHRPSITCLSKGLTGGTLPLGATICERRIYEGFLDDSLEQAFLHGHSFCGSPLACAAALASLDLHEDPRCDASRKAIEQQHTGFKSSYQDHPGLVRCDVAGTILAIEYKESTASANGRGYFSRIAPALKSRFLAERIYVRPMGNVLYLIPPYCSTRGDLEHTYSCIRKTLEDLQ